MLKNRMNFLWGAKPQEPIKGFIIPNFPCYAALAWRGIGDVNIENYFSGKMDDRSTHLTLFSSKEDAAFYLKEQRCPNGRTFIFCLDDSLENMEKLQETGLNFGAHIVKAIDYTTYAMSKWEIRAIHPDEVKVMDNHHYNPRKSGERHMPE